MGVNDTKNYDVPRNDVICGRLLGRGMVEVWSGVWKNRGGNVDVAIKKVLIFII